MISPIEFLHALHHHGIDSYYGVPDSLLKSFGHALNEAPFVQHHHITPNEGIAISRAIGYYSATQKVPVVYMQNSGLGNAVNPLLSLADSQVYGVPMLLIVGWRGEMLATEQLADEPQHRKQGRVTTELIDAMGYPCVILDKNSDFRQVIDDSLQRAKQLQAPVFLVVRKGTFSACDSSRDVNRFDLSREHAIETVLQALPEDCISVATTGKAGREIFELRKTLNMPHNRDFLCVGGMGHASSIAAEIAHHKPDRPVVCFDGDGAVLMHLASLQHAASQPNLLHIVLNNCAHESVGGQRTQFDDLEVHALAQAFGYQHFAYVTDVDAIGREVDYFLTKPTSTLLIIGCKIGSRDDLGRPTISTQEQYAAFTEFVSSY
ncbi:phosphonopyruvate decarboxylase [Vibrio vulnificus]|uniref:phosphonopyruvate decarboxylase n=1 Tax=Vibrio vulnificus TaxID=672 RepID=UPI0010288627|nr:phosphonopyruvate decarboxylase [Vibrio vulnificus]RZP72485.1 phosphonopyruvate decarboxylase [Vibrio vulnificus]RZP73830.1 phosphonopyruvate decarboxylase [Vibrio vulnificus]